MCAVYKADMKKNDRNTAALICKHTFIKKKKKKHLSCAGFVHAQQEKMVSTFTVKDPKIDPFPIGDNICRHTKAHDNLSILGKNKNN